MEIGIDSFAAAISDPVTGATLSPAERLHHLLEEITLADQVGLELRVKVAVYDPVEFTTIDSLAAGEVPVSYCMRVNPLPGASQ